VYQSMIQKAIACTPEDARLVEAWMRLERGCLDGLDRRTFLREAAAGIACVAADKKASERLAESYGL